MLAEWAKKTFPDDRVVMRARVGTPPKEHVDMMGLERANAAYKPFMRWVDAIVLRPTEAILVEAKIRGNPSAVAQLKYYEDLFRKTLDYKAWWARPARLVLLTPWGDPDLEDYARRQGVAVEHFAPAWLDPYMRHVQGYASPAYRLRKDAEKNATDTEGPT